MNTHFLKHLEQVAIMHRSGAFAGLSDVVQSIGGKPPESLASFIRRNIDVFGGQPAIAGSAA